MDELLKCSTCMQTKLTKLSAGQRSLRDRVTQPYQLLYAGYAFSGIVQKDKEGNVIESSRKDVEGLNGEVARISISDGVTRMSHADFRLSKASPIKWLESFLTEYSPERKEKFVVLNQSGELY